MADYHDPVRHADSLSQVYAQDKRPLGIFITAGCPYAVKAVGTGAPLLPDIAGLTIAVGASLSGAEADTFALALRTLHEDGVAAPNIEDILTFVRSLYQVVGGGAARGFSKPQLEALDLAVSESIATIVDVPLPLEVTPFDRVAQWIGSTRRAFPVELFTTNYDLLIERALERHHIPFFDGFVGAENAFFDQRSIEEDPLPARWARVWKLHGSINWHLDSAGNTVRTGVKLSGESRLIHPSHLKYSARRRMPYLTIIDRMRAFLKYPSAVLMVCGYSFRDEHLNEVLLQAAEANPSTAVFALQFGPLDEYPSALGIASACQNFNVLAANEAVIGSARAPWKSPEDILDSDRLATFWQRDTGGIVGEPVTGRFLLGDFVRLGKFLSLLVASSDAD